MISTAVAGTRSLLSAAFLHKTKRLIITSSATTMIGTLWKKGENANYYDENDFAPAESTKDGYTLSKIYSERIIREFIEE